MRITTETTIAPGTASSFYHLYLAAFEPLRTRAAARQVLTRKEFFADMVDPRVEKHVGWDAYGTPIALTTLTRHLETVPWISPEFFAERFPDHTARGTLYYLGFTLVHPCSRSALVFAEILGSIVNRLRLEGAACAYDICAYNNESIRFASHLERLLRRSLGVAVSPVDTQTYYCVVQDAAALVPSPRVGEGIAAAR
jgi:hypothetical protein